MEEKRTQTGWQRYLSNIIFYSLIFLSLFIFFAQVHPLMMYCGDDWSDINHTRYALPEWGAHNPIKILPCELFPIAGYLAAYLVNPFLHDYIFSITVTSAILYSGLIVWYLYFFSRFIQHIFSLQRYQNYLVTLIFFLLHFLIFKAGKGSLSPYLFGSVNLTCIYHYSIPALVNFLLVFYLFDRSKWEHWQESKHIFSAGILLLGLYLAIFSNIQQSIIVASFIGMVLFIRFGKRWLHIKEWKYIFQQIPLFFGLIIIWFVSLIFEANGGNADDIAHDILHLPIREAVQAFLQGSHFNLTFLALAILSIGAAFWYFHRGLGSAEIRHGYRMVLYISVGAMLLTWIYLLLVCSKAVPTYFGRSDVLISFYGWLLIVICSSIAFLLKEKPKIFLAAPIFLFIIFIEVISTKSIYAEVQINQISAKTAYAVDYDLINQIQTAEQSGKKEAILHVPQGDNRDNWPHPLYMGPSIANTLYRHGLVTKVMKITIQPDAAMNEKYQIPIVH